MIIYVVEFKSYYKPRRHMQLFVHEFADDNRNLDLPIIIIICQTPITREFLVLWAPGQGRSLWSTTQNTQARNNWEKLISQNWFHRESNTGPPHFNFHSADRWAIEVVKSNLYTFLSVLFVICDIVKHAFYIRYYKNDASSGLYRSSTVEAVTWPWITVSGATCLRTD